MKQKRSRGDILAEAQDLMGCNDPWCIERVRELIAEFSETEAELLVIFSRPCGSVILSPEEIEKAELSVIMGGQERVVNIHDWVKVPDRDEYTTFFKYSKDASRKRLVKRIHHV